MLISIVTIRPSTPVLARVMKFAAMRRRLGGAVAESGFAGSIGSPSVLLTRLMVRGSGVVHHASWQRCHLRLVTKLCPMARILAFVDRRSCHERQRQAA